MNFLHTDQDFNALTLADLLAARDQFHVHLMNKSNVVGTAVGRYRIRDDDGAAKMAPRTLQRSSVRPESWPALLVFVSEWQELDTFAHPDEALPRAVYMPDGRRVPICVVLAPTDDRGADLLHPTYPASVLGGGYPVLVDVQGREHAASVGCLVSDGHTTYAVTNRHVCGNPGETVYSMLAGNKVPIGRSSDRSRTRVAFTDIYRGWPGTDTYVNLDVGLIEIDDLNRWTTSIYGCGEPGPLADVSSLNLSLSIIGCHVKAHGAGGGAMAGEVAGLFYRFKSVGGFEYISDVLIGPRRSSGKPLGTRPGDSGSLWIIDQPGGPLDRASLAIQWGGQTFHDGENASTFALATFLSTVCSALEVDLVRSWQVQSNDFWGAVGHYGIATLAIDLLPNDSRLRKLMTNNADRISYDLPRITKANMEGLSKLAFVPLADVPDMVWKVGPHKRGGMNAPEHHNHFADMDRTLDPPLPGGATLLEICTPPGPGNVNVATWQRYYDEVQKQYPGEEESRGLLPFRCWQIYDAMVAYVKAGDVVGFLCAAGILSHYVGDSCQPLHISYLFNGDPDRQVEGKVKDEVNGGTKPGMVPYAKGVHAAYEDDMVDYHVDSLFPLVQKTAQAHGLDVLVEGGQQAAIDVVRLMQFTFACIKPMDLVEAYARSDGKLPKPRAEDLWAQFGDPTAEVMAAGCCLLATLWQSAWKEGGGEAQDLSADVIAEKALAKRYQDPKFLPSYTLHAIGPVLG